MKLLYVVGLGPGNTAFLTPQAHQALENSQVLCGYTTYLDLIRPEFPEKEYISTPMTQEIARCRLALQSANQGKTTSMVCSGDPGVYGMAGPILQLAEEFPDVEVQILPGITAALSGAALLGAPLMHDFAVISLSDLLTPWETIEKRLEMAGIGDFSICLYNPASRKRKENLRRACEILLRHKSEETVCGWVRNVGRDGENGGILPLKELKDFQADMFTTVFIGSSATQNLNGRMVTPRGYEGKK